MVLDKLETTRHGFFKKDKQDHWEQYVFRVEDSACLRYYSDLKKVNIRRCLNVNVRLDNHSIETSRRTSTFQSQLC